MPYEPTSKTRKGQKLYRTPSGMLVTRKQIGAIEAKKKEKRRHGAKTTPRSQRKRKGHGEKQTDKTD